LLIFTTCQDEYRRPSIPRFLPIFRRTGKLLYENDNIDWVKQMASNSLDYQKWIVALILDFDSSQR